MNDVSLRTSKLLFIFQFLASIAIMFVIYSIHGSYIFEIHDAINGVTPFESQIIDLEG